MDRNFSKHESDYQIGKYLGRGTFGQVFQCEYQLHSYAIKILSKEHLTPKIEQQIKNEVGIHFRLQHKNIIALHTFFQDEAHVYLVMELANGGSLASYIKSQPSGRCTEYRTRILMGEILDALRYLHKNNIIHRDVTTTNILLDEDHNIKLCDFGLATLREDRSKPSSTMCGTPNFIAPEIVTRQGHNKKVDVFSLGCVLYTMLAGKPPFDTESTRETLQRVRDLQFDMPAGLSVEAENLIRRLIQKSPTRRPTLEDVARDPFLQPPLNDSTNDTSNVATKDTGIGSTFSSRHTSTSSRNHLAKSYTPQIRQHVQNPMRAFHTPLTNITEESRSRIFTRDNAFQAIPDRRPAIPARRQETLDDSVIEMSTRTDGEFSGLRKGTSLTNLNSGHHHARHRSEPEPHAFSMQTKAITKAPMLPKMVPHLNLGGPQKSGVSSSFHTEPAGELARPLSTKRLRPETNRSGLARASVLGNNKGCALEMHKHSVVTQVMHISCDGMKITVGVPSQKPPLSADPVSLEQCKNVQRYSFDNLPQKFFKKYKHLRKLCDLIRGKTPKVTVYTDQAKCILMESASSNSVSGNFEANFYDPESKCELSYDSSSYTRPTKITFTVKNSSKFDVILPGIDSLSEELITKKLLADMGVENSYQGVENRSSIYCGQIRHAWEGRAQLEALESSYREMEAKQEGGNGRKGGGFSYSIFPVIHGNPGRKGGNGSGASTPLSTSAPNSARNSSSTKSSSIAQRGLSSIPQRTQSEMNLATLGSINPADIASYEVSPPHRRDGSLQFRRRATSPQKHPSIPEHAAHRFEERFLSNSLGVTTTSTSSLRSTTKGPIATRHGNVVNAGSGVVYLMFQDGSCAMTEASGHRNTWKYTDAGGKERRQIPNEKLSVIPEMLSEAKRRQHAGLE